MNDIVTGKKMAAKIKAINRETGNTTFKLHFHDDINTIHIPWTGTTDDNDNEIYEGDILQITVDSSIVYAVVEWGDVNSQWVRRLNQTTTYPLLPKQVGETNTTIVGDVYINIGDFKVRTDRTKTSLVHWVEV